MSFKGWKFKITLVICGIMLACVLVLVSPLFHIQEIVVQGAVRVCQAEIRDRLGLDVGSNILMFNPINARERIMGNLHIGDVRFVRDMPGRLYVIVQERRPSAYVEHTPGNFLVLDDTGRVLEIRTHMDVSLPLLEGLQFTRHQLGEILEATNPADFLSIVHYTQLLITHGLIHTITHINVSDPANIRILVNYMEFHVGCTTDADYKVRTIAQMLEASPDAGIMRGYVDMRVRRPEYFFVLLQ